MGKIWVILKENGHFVPQVVKFAKMYHNRCRDAPKSTHHRCKFLQTYPSGLHIRRYLASYFWGVKNFSIPRYICSFWRVARNICSPPQVNYLGGCPAPPPWGGAWPPNGYRCPGGALPLFGWVGCAAIRTLFARHFALTRACGQICCMNYKLCISNK